MAITAYRTWVANQPLLAAQLNEQVRDNGNQTPSALASAAGQAVFSTAANTIAMVTGAKYKTADESVNNSTVLQNDDHLSFAIAASEVWAFSMFLYFTIASGDPGMKFAFTVPASCTGWYHLVGNHATSIDGLNTTSGQMGHASIATSRSWAMTGITDHLAVIRGVIINGANAGTIQFQWAQNTGVASNLTLKLGSYMDLKRLA